MKCIKLNSGEVIRVEDKEAEELVDKNEGYYVPKAAWKRRQGIGKGDGKIRVSRAKVEFPESCPANCPEKESPFFQGNLCCRCPIFSCGGEHPLIEPEFYREDWAREWKRWLTSGMKGLPNLTFYVKEGG